MDWTLDWRTWIWITLWTRLWNGILTPNSASMYRGVSVEWIPANILQTARVHWWEPVLLIYDYYCAIMRWVGRSKQQKRAGIHNFAPAGTSGELLFCLFSAHGNVTCQVWWLQHFGKWQMIPVKFASTSRRGNGTCSVELTPLHQQPAAASLIVSVICPLTEI